MAKSKRDLEKALQDTGLGNLTKEEEAAIIKDMQGTDTDAEFIAKNNINEKDYILNSNASSSFNLDPKELIREAILGGLTTADGKNYQEMSNKMLNDKI